MAKQKAKQNFFKTIFFIFLLLFSTLSSAKIESNTVNTDSLKSQEIQKFNDQACNFILSTTDWRILVAIGLLLSSVFVAALYLYGSFFDSSFIDKAKEELFQLFFTSLLAILFIFIVQTFLCTNIISSIFGIDDMPYIASFNYISQVQAKASSYSIIFGAVGVLISLVSSSDYIGSSVTSSSIFSFINDPISYFANAAFVIFNLFITSYLMMLSLSTILMITPLISLKFFIPIGIVLRSIYPLRRFGGGLIGIGVALYVFLPFTLLLNNIIVSSYLTEPIKELSLQCNDNADCYSHLCTYNQDLGIKVCSPMKAAGETCYNNFECQSNLCMPTGNPTGNVKQCSSCASEGRFASESLPCCKGLIENLDTHVCELPNASEQQCKTNSDCAFSVCKFSSQNNKNICMPLSKIDENCSSDEDCISRNCIGTAPNKVCGRSILTELDQKVEYERISPFINIIPNAENILTELSLSRFQIDSDQPQPYSIGGIYDSIIKSVVIIVIAGLVLPLLNLTIIAKATLDLSSALGQEIETASIWRLI